MKLTERYFWGFLGLSSACGLIFYLLVTWIWYGMSHVNWLEFPGMAVGTIILWAVGATIAWLVTSSKNKRWMWLTTYLMTTLLHTLSSIILDDWNDPSINGWLFMFAFGFAIIAFPVAILLWSVSRKMLKS